MKRKLSRAKANRTFRSGQKVNGKNVARAPQRGGWRL